MTRYEPHCDCLGGHCSMVPDPNGRWCRAADPRAVADDPSGIVQQMPEGGDDTLAWQSLHEWTPKEGTWAILWPGHYGPFTACWMRGRWTMCEDIDFKNATIGAEMQLPHLVTEAVPFVDRGGYSIPRSVGEDSAKMIAQFMRDCNELSVEAAAYRLVEAIKAKVREYEDAGI